MIRLLLPLLALAAAIWASRVVNPSELGKRFERIETWIRRWWGGPLAAAVVTIATVWWTWGSLAPLPMTHDEASYALQAEIFARGAWTAPAPALPEFFEQPQVLVAPAVASRFPPGHALLLAVGALLRFPPLVPLLIAGFTAALIVVVASRLVNPWVALLAWLIWLTTPLVLRFQPGYYAESTVVLAVLSAWWCVARWRDGGGIWWTAGAGVAVGWGAITQPATTLAFAVPVVAVLLRDALRGKEKTRREWLALPVLVVAAGAVLALVPLWSARTTGDAWLTPAALYTRDYLPFDRPGAGVIGDLADTVPRRPLTPVLESLREDLLRQHRALAPNRLAGTVLRRMGALAGDLWQGASLVLLPFFAIGLYAMTPPLRLGLIGAGLLFLFRVPFPQASTWTLPYLAVAPVVAAVTAWGFWRVLEWAASGVVVRLHVERRPKLGTALVALVLAFFAAPTLATWRLRHQQTTGMRAAFDDAMRQLPSSKSIVFLRYADRHEHLSLVFNHPDLAAEPVWVVHDLGARNRELMALAQDRTAYVFDEQTMEFRRY